MKRYLKQIETIKLGAWAEENRVPLEKDGATQELAAIAASVLGFDVTVNNLRSLCKVMGIEKKGPAQPAPCSEYVARLEFLERSVLTICCSASMDDLQPIINTLKARTGK